MDDELYEVEFSVLEDRPRRSRPQVVVDLTEEPDSPPPPNRPATWSAHPIANNNRRRPTPQSRRNAPSPAREPGGAFPRPPNNFHHPAVNDDADPIIDLTGDDPPSPPPGAATAAAAADPRNVQLPTYDDIIMLQRHTHPHTHTHTHAHTHQARENRRLRVVAEASAAERQSRVGTAQRRLEAHRHQRNRDPRRLAGAFIPGLAAYLRPDMHAIFPGQLPNEHHAHAHAHGQGRPDAPGLEELELEYHIQAFRELDHQYNNGTAAVRAEAVNRTMMEIPAAREGFSRDTGEEVVAVCPACSGELEYDPGKEGVKKRKRDKGDHHFWAVKACGHVRFWGYFLFLALFSCSALNPSFCFSSASDILQPEPYRSGPFCQRLLVKEIKR